MFNIYTVKGIAIIKKKIRSNGTFQSGQKMANKFHKVT